MSLSAMLALGAAALLVHGSASGDRGYFALGLSCAVAVAVIQVAARRVARRQLVQEALAQGSSSGEAEQEARRILASWLR